MQKNIHCYNLKQHLFLISWIKILCGSMSETFLTHLTLMLKGDTLNTEYTFKPMNYQK